MHPVRLDEHRLPFCDLAEAPYEIDRVVHGFLGIASADDRDDAFVDARARFSVRATVILAATTDAERSEAGPRDETTAAE